MLLLLFLMVCMRRTVFIVFAFSFIDRYRSCCFIKTLLRTFASMPSCKQETQLTECTGSLLCFSGAGCLLSSSNRTHHCLIVRLMLCLIVVEKTAPGKSAKQDTERQGTKGPVEGMPEC